MLRGFVVASFLLQFVGGVTADAADVKVLSAVGMREVMRRIGLAVVFAQIR